jgi:hypothetical protein
MPPRLVGTAGGGGGVVRGVSGQAELGAGDLVPGVFGAGSGRQYVGVGCAGKNGDFFGEW